MKSFADPSITLGAAIRDGSRSYAPTQTAYGHKPSVFNPGIGLLRCALLISLNYYNLIKIILFRYIPLGKPNARRRRSVCSVPRCVLGI